VATWHQDRGGILPALYAEHPTSYKVVNNKPNAMASVALFSDKQKAKAHAKVTGGTLIPPENECEEVSDEHNYICSDLYDCCSCGGVDCGCRYCFDCNACDNCKGARE